MSARKMFCSGGGGEYLLLSLLFDYNHDRWFLEQVLTIGGGVRYHRTMKTTLEEEPELVNLLPLWHVQASRKQAGTHTNLQSCDPSFRRVVRAPSFMRDMDAKDGSQNERRHRRRPSSGTELRSRQVGDRRTGKIRKQHRHVVSLVFRAMGPSACRRDREERTYKLFRPLLAILEVY